MEGFPLGGATMVSAAMSPPAPEPLYLQKPWLARGVGGIGRDIKSLAAWKAFGVKGARRCKVPRPLPGVGGGSWTRLSALGGVTRSNCGSGKDEWPRVGLTASAAPCLSLLSNGESPLSARCFLCVFLSTGDGDWSWEEHNAAGAIRMEAEALGADSEQDSSEDSLSAASMSRAFRQMSLSF